MQVVRFSEEKVPAGQGRQKPAPAGLSVMNPASQGEHEESPNSAFFPIKHASQRSPLALGTVPGEHGEQLVASVFPSVPEAHISQ